MQTVEKVPHIDHYRDMLSIQKAITSRPTLAELHEGDVDEVGKEIMMINWMSGLVFFCFQLSIFETLATRRRR